MVKLPEMMKIHLCKMKNEGSIMMVKDNMGAHCQPLWPAFPSRLERMPALMSPLKLFANADPP